MKTQGLPVSLNPFVASIASNETHVVYPASSPGFFILENIELGDSNTLDCTGAGIPTKFVFGRHNVALLTSTMVLFWSIDSGTPLENWNEPVQDVYCEYGDWKLAGPNVIFDPRGQSSKNTEIESKPPIVFKGRSVWVGQHLHVGDQAFDLGPIDSIASFDHYIITGHGNTITVLFDLKEVGSVEVDEPVLALTGAVVDDDLEIYFITPTKVSQITAELEFNEISPLESTEDSSRSDVVISGYFAPQSEPAQSAPQVQVPTDASQEQHNTQASSDLLALLRKPTPPKAPSTTSLPAMNRECFSAPVDINESHTSNEDLKALVKPRIQALPENRAKTKPTPSDSEFIPRKHFDSVVTSLSQEIYTLKARIAELEGTPTQAETQNKPVSSPKSTQKSKQVPKPSTSATPTTAASVADAVKKTLDGHCLLPYLEQNMQELNTYLDSAPIETSQLIKLVLIDAYHNTKLSKTLADNFGPPVIDASYYNKIVGRELGN